MALGGVIEWETTFAKTEKTRSRYTIRTVVGESSLQVSQIKGSKKAPGTKVMLSHVSDKGNTLDAASVRCRFSLIFSENLSNYSDIALFIQSERLEARWKAHRFLRKTFRERAESFADELAEQGVLPYPSVPKSVEQERQKKMFSEMALHINQNVGSYDKMNLDNKRLLFKLLQGVIELDSARAVDILNGALKMSAEDCKALMKLTEAVGVKPR